MCDDRDSCTGPLDFCGNGVCAGAPIQCDQPGSCATATGAFCDSVRNGTPPAISGLDGLKAQEVIQAAYLSMRRGGWVDLPLPADAPFIVPDYQRG